MALPSSSPRKVVPLNSGDDRQSSNKPKPSPTLTKRAFFCGVVVESPGAGKQYSEDVQDLVASLGDSIDPNDVLPSRPETPSAERSENDGPYTRKRAMTDASALADQINEFVTTERSYVKKLHILKHDYADPLRSFARSKETAILPPYEAKTLFGNVDNLLPVNEAFLADLEIMVQTNGSGVLGGIGDVALRHFRDLKGFEHYKQYYTKREEAQAIFERELAKRSSSFAAYIDRIKYSSADIRNRVGLRELLMDPVQRIPRYTLMFRNMVKRMAPDDPQRAKLIEADAIASKIALAETDEQTKRAQVMYCLSATIEAFPPALISNSRRFVDCIDVEDMLSDSSSGFSNQGQAFESLHCSLVLFDDKLLIVKRPGHGEKGARALSGLNDLDKLTKSGGKPGMKKSGMSSKGVVEVIDVVVTDVGGSDFHLYLEKPPQDQTDRWTGRPFRALTVVHPPGGPNSNPTQTEIDKKKFLENLWTVQAKYRTKTGQSVALRSEEQDVESRGGRTTIARTYFNIYQRTSFLREPQKTKVIVHVDPFGTADVIPTTMSAPPYVVIRVQPMAGELCRFVVTSSDMTDEGEQDIIQTDRVTGRIIQTIHQYGLFKFSTGNNSRPSTPTASIRSRAAIFGLDAISRNLFNAKPGLSAKGDIFGSVNSKRAKSTTSKSSISTQSTTTGDSSLTRFSRTDSTITAATTMSLMDNESFATSKSLTRNKLVKRGKSPAGSENESSPVRSQSRSRPQTPSREPSRERVHDDMDDEEGIPKLDASHLRRLEGLDESELDLAMRLELARRNSENQHVRRKPVPVVDEPVEETIYEDAPPLPLRPSSRASRDSHGQESQRSSTPRPRSTTPTPDSPPRHSRSTSQHSSERRPMGPRSPSPLPSSSRPSTPVALSTPDLDLALETTLVNVSLSHLTPIRPVSPLPRSKRQPFEPTGNTETTPKAALPLSGIPKLINSVEPLSIKKRTSIRSPPNHGRKTTNKHSPLSKSRMIASRKVSQTRSQQQSTAVPDAEPCFKAEDLDKLIQLAESTKFDVNSSRRAMKRMRLELDQFNPPSSRSLDDLRLASPSPTKGIPRTPQHPTTPVTREAQARLDEMRQLIGKRHVGDATPRTPQRNVIDTPRRNCAEFEKLAQSIEGYIFDADGKLAKALAAQDELQADIKTLATSLKERAIEMERSRVELQNTKRQCELVKSLLADSNAEKEIMYEAFNEELDSMYNDAQLPEDEAWTALTMDLRETKEARNKVSNENSQLKRRLAEVEQQKEEWGALLRAHGLIP